MAAWTYPVVDPIMFEIGPLAVRWYGVAYILGFVLAAGVFWDVNKRWGIRVTAQDVLDIVLYGGLGLVVGARLGYVLFYNLEYYLQHPVRTPAIWDGGMSFHGGLAGILIMGALMARRLRIPFLRLCDGGAVGAPLGLFLGRLANFIKPELWGRESDVPWAMVFPGAGTEPRHPSQLYEAFGEGLVIFVVLFALSRRKRPDGLLFGLLLTMYGIVRTLVEFVREPDPQLGLVVGGVTMGQLLTLPVLIIGIWLVSRAVLAARREASQPGDAVGPEGS